MQQIPRLNRLISVRRMQTPPGTTNEVTPMAELLIMEPQQQTSQALERILAQAGHDCKVCQSAQEGIECVYSGRHSLAILNARMPWSESYSLLRLMAEKHYSVLFLTSESDNEAHLRTLYQGACDVLVVPSSSAALLQKVDALLSDAHSVLAFGSIRMDLHKHIVTLDEEEMTLTAQEFSLLQALLQSPDVPLSRADLLRKAWGYEALCETRTVDVHIQRLRRKLGNERIETVYKMGYRLKAV